MRRAQAEMVNARGREKGKTPPRRERTSTSGGKTRISVKSLTRRASDQKESGGFENAGLGRTLENNWGRNCSKDRKRDIRSRSKNGKPKTKETEGGKSLIPTVGGGSAEKVDCLVSGGSARCRPLSIEVPEKGRLPQLAKKPD